MLAKQLCELCLGLYSKRSSLTSLWQEVAENFYPERADFTIRRSLGTDFADNLTTSYPLIARRDLGNAFSAMLRPTETPWFHTTVTDDERLTLEARRWLERAEKLQRRAMYDRKSQFVRATKEGDHDFAAFGQCAISTELNREASGLLYRCWHLRDMAWLENEEGGYSVISRKWKPTHRELVRIFGTSKLHKDIVDGVAKKPNTEVECIHMVVEADMADLGEATSHVSIYYDVTHQTVIEEVGVRSAIYTIPRWQTVSGSQYAFSPATVAALPDARLIQSMMYTLLEAGEKHTSPPMVAVQEAIRGDVSLYAGGITWVDEKYDERLGEVLRPITQDKSGMPLGMEMASETRIMIAEAFFLNKLTLPQRGPEMTAYETGQRIQEYIRNAVPLFEPMEVEYNGALCEETFRLMLRSGAFGSPFDMPESLQAAEVQFKFESPLHDAIEREKGNRFMEAQSIVVSAAQLDPSSLAILDARVAVRDVLEGLRVPAKWTHSVDEVDKIVEQNQQAQESAQMLEQLQAGADTAKTMGEASQALGTIAQ